MSSEDRSGRYRISGERGRNFSEDLLELEVSGEGKPRRELQKELLPELRFALDKYDQALQLKFRKFLNEWVEEFCIEVIDQNNGDFGVRIHDDSLEDVVTFPSLREVLRTWADDFDPSSDTEGVEIVRLRSLAAYLDTLACEMEAKFAKEAKSQAKG